MQTTMSALIARALLKEYSQKHQLWSTMVQDTTAQITKALHVATAAAKRTEVNEKEDSYRR